MQTLLPRTPNSLVSIDASPSFSSYPTFDECSDECFCNGAFGNEAGEAVPATHAGHWPKLRDPIQGRLGVE
eukprot:10101113-Alexandrium_andersonii.AAC.1